MEQTKDLQSTIFILIVIVLILSVCLMVAFVFLKEFYQSGGTKVTIKADGVEGIDALKDLKIDSYLQDLFGKIPMYTITPTADSAKKEKPKKKKSKIYTSKRPKPKAKP